MTVTAILRQKGSSEVATIGSQSTVGECARLLAERRIGALVVSDDGATVDGIISERDVVKAIAEFGPSGLTKPVAALMTRRVETCAPEERSHALLERMTAGRFRHLPVVDKGRMVALISIGDVVKYRISEMQMEKEALEGMIKGF
jgi:CBS domain-containing protein